MGDNARSQEQRRLSSSSGEFREADDPWLRRIFAWSFDTYRLQAPGMAELQTRELEASLPFYRETVHLAPGDGLAYDALGNLYLQLNRPNEARATLEAGIAAAPRTLALYGSLAEALRQQGRPSEAVAALQRGLARARAARDRNAAAALEQLLARPSP